MDKRSESNTDSESFFDKVHKNPTGHDKFFEQVQCIQRGEPIPESMKSHREIGPMP